MPSMDNSGDFFPTTSTIYIVPGPRANRFHSLRSGNDCLEHCSIKSLKAIFRFRRKTNKPKMGISTPASALHSLRWSLELSSTLLSPSHLPLFSLLLSPSGLLHVTSLHGAMSTLPKDPLHSSLLTHPTSPCPDKTLLLSIRNLSAVFPWAWSTSMVLLNPLPMLPQSVPLPFIPQYIPIYPFEQPTSSSTPPFPHILSATYFHPFDLWNSLNPPPALPQPPASALVTSSSEETWEVDSTQLPLPQPVTFVKHWFSLLKRL